MSGLLKRFEWFYQFLASKKLTLILLGILGLMLIPRTFSEEKEIYLGIPGTAIFGLFSLNLILCTFQRIKTIARSVLIMHVGVLLTFAGVVISATGYVATVNIYEGDSVDTVYRWDKEKDMPLGVNLKVKKINLEYYPAPVKVGVLNGEEKVGLFMKKTGESFNVAGHTVKIDSLDVESKNLSLRVFLGENLIGSVETAGTSELPADFPFTFVLVAYQDTALNKAWIDLELFNDSKVLAEGSSAVNNPMTWEDLNFHHVKVDYDSYGNRYAGIQITYDPGVPYVYAGFSVLALGCVMQVYRRLYGRR